MQQKESLGKNKKIMYVISITKHQCHIYWKFLPHENSTERPRIIDFKFKRNSYSSLIIL